MPENSIHRTRIDPDSEPTFFTEANFGEDDDGNAGDASFADEKQARNDKLSPKSNHKPEPNKRHGMALKTTAKNHEMAEVAASPIWRDRKIQMAAAPKLVPEAEMEQRMAGIAKNLEDVRRRHETFVPGVDTEGITSSSSKKKHVMSLTPEEQRERFELLKFVRKIEPELPPLVKSPVTEKEPPKDQTSVKWNCSQLALKLQESKAQRKAIAKRADETAHQVRSVLENKQIIQAEKMQRKKELAVASENRGVSQEEIYHRQHVSAMMIFMQAWVAAGFLIRARDERDLNKMEFKGRMDLVENRGAEITHTMRSSVLVQEAEQMKDALSDQLFLKYKDMLKATFERKSAVKLMRQQARIIHSGLQAWHAFGHVAVRLKFIQKSVKSIQHWWKSCQKRLHASFKKVDTLWQKVEQADLMEQMRKEYESLGKPFKKMDPSVYESRLHLRMLSEDVRLTFVVHELRSRRFRILPRLNAYDKECRKWKHEMLEAQEALRLLNLQRASSSGEGADLEGDEHRAKIMLFRWPPARGPSYLPGPEEVMDMITRARADPTDWLPLPKVAGSSRDSKSGGSKKGSKSRSGSKRRASVDVSASAVVAQVAASVGKFRKAKTSPGVLTSNHHVLPTQDDEPTSEVEVEDEEPDFVDEELEALGCRPSMMPGGIAKPPPSLPD